MGHYFIDFVGILLGLLNLKMISITLNTSIHIDLGRFVGIEHVLFKD